MVISLPMKMNVILKYRNCLIMKKMMILKTLTNNKSTNQKIRFRNFQITLLVNSQAKLKVNYRILKKENIKHKLTKI